MIIIVVDYLPVDVVVEEIYQFLAMLKIKNEYPISDQPATHAHTHTHTHIEQLLLSHYNRSGDYSKIFKIKCITISSNICYI